MKNVLFIVVLIVIRTTVFGQNIKLEPLFEAGVYFNRTEGARLNVYGICIESENKIRCSTNNFVKNKPYLVEFYLRACYDIRKITVGIEHLCLHPIMSEDMGLVYNKRGGHNKTYFSYNINR